MAVGDARLLGSKVNTVIAITNGNNLYHCRYPWARRNIQRELDNLYDVDNETRKSVRKTLSSEIGFTGTSVFHRYLYPLDGFDILQHIGD